MDAYTYLHHLCFCLTHHVLRLMDAAAAQISAIAHPFGKDQYQALLEHPRVELNSCGTKKELLHRIYQERLFIAAQLSLDRSILDLDTDPYGGVQGDSNDDPITCGL